eukprot:NODE_5251_length_292_cov_1.296296_g5168_i0.p1 GENE.NODE_5251_length_292_cov_1.296296_g5168_i0~~NODE_5251_length_292_cov_1.296296_g5168_i0.p1  ORF type:complete len:80 (-),score=9.02 NODE_5251_length_292_cov_1.296296_g5168_i0:27-266(-)
MVTVTFTVNAPSPRGFVFKPTPPRARYTDSWAGGKAPEEFLRNRAEWELEHAHVNWLDYSDVNGVYKKWRPFSNITTPG